ncbi:hypothetical protein TNCV_1654361 [Trichonephila clavipes]|nr:hypothetical protein TNCV_1654361 [Trichonephila clavipes]
MRYQACLGLKLLGVSLQTDHLIRTSAHAPQSPMVMYTGRMVPRDGGEEEEDKKVRERENGRKERRRKRGGERDESRRRKKRVGESESEARLEWRKGLSPELGEKDDERWWR